MNINIKKSPKNPKFITSIRLGKIYENTEKFITS
jgi:hypothetical protein